MEVVNSPFAFWMDELMFGVSMVPMLTFNPFTAIQNVILAGATFGAIGVGG